MLKLPNNWKSFQSYIILGGEYAHTELIKFLEKEGINTNTDNPDFISFITNKALTIGEARELINNHSVKKITSGPRVFIIRTDSINYEAQNALLKIIEEPSEDNYIFIITGNRNNFLPTILSRVITLNFSSNENKYLTRARDFINSPKKKRLDMVSKLIGDIDDESISRNDLVEFLEALEINLSNDFKENKDIAIMDSLKSVSIAERYASDRSPSRKMIMEYLAVMI